MSVALKPPAVLTSISGCEGSGMAMCNRIPDTGSLLILGSGLSILAELYSYRINTGNSNSYSNISLSAKWR